VIANGNVNDGSQVEQNYVDILAFMNASMPHSDGTGGAADTRGLVFGKVADVGKKLVFGTGTVTAVSGHSSDTTTVVFGITFGNVPVVLVTGRTATPNPYLFNGEQETTTQFVARAQRSDGNNFTGGAALNFAYVAIG
jgi:hypothetical protein